MLSELLRNEGYLSEDEAAKAVGKTKRTLQSWRQQRIGPAWTYNGQDVLYHKDWIFEHLKATKQQPVRSRGGDRGSEHKHRASQRSAREQVSA
jgi:hypothetical protein